MSFGISWLPAVFYGAGGMLTVSGKRFTELQDEFIETSKRLRLARTPEEKLELLNELQRIVKESKRALAEPDSKKSK